MEPLSFESISVEATKRLATVVAEISEPGDLIALLGPLGAGKTTFVRALCEGLAVPRDAGVSSPSYALVNHYEGGRYPIAHLDLYRITDEDELEALGFRDLLDGTTLVVIEWPEKAPSLLQLADLRIEIEDKGGDHRIFEIIAPALDLQRKLSERLRLLEMGG